MLLIAGLGNPGFEYEQTRHNAGFMVLDLLIANFAFQKPVNFSANLISKGHLKGQSVILVWPQLFMNVSGPAILQVLSFYKISLENFIVLYDDMDLNPGLIKMSKGGGSAGHKGIKSIVDTFGTSDFAKIRIGIGRPPKNFSTVSYVLNSFDSEEEKEITLGLKKAVDASVLWAKSGFVEAQNLFNRKI